MVEDGELELGGGEGQAAHPGDRAGVDQVLGPQLAGELAEVELGDDHPRVAPQDVAEVPGQRVQVGEVDLGHAVAAPAHPRGGAVDRPPRRAPTHDDQLGVVDVAGHLRLGDVVGDA